MAAPGRRRRHAPGCNDIWKQGLGTQLVVEVDDRHEDPVVWLQGELDLTNEKLLEEAPSPLSIVSYIRC